MSSILFVCTANRIRSPLAEHLFLRALSDAGEDLANWDVKSAGTWTSAGLPAMPLAQQAGQELGLDLARHRSTPVEDRDLNAFDLVVVMEQGQREALIFETPMATDRVHLLGELATGLVYDVADPIGGPLSSYVTAAQELDRLIGMALPRIMALTRNADAGPE